MRAHVSRYLFLSIVVVALAACGEGVDRPSAPLSPEQIVSYGKDGGSNVAVDIQPLMSPNRITRFPWGIMRAALVGTEEFDVRDVDVSSVRLEGIRPFRRRYRDVTNPGAASDCRTGSSVIRINAGGLVEAGDPQWLEDTQTNKSAWVNTGFAVIGTETIDMSHPSVPAGTPMSVFQSERYDGTADPDMVWDIPVPNGDHLLRMYFVDRYPPAHRPGGRLFDVTVEGELRLDDYDIFVAAGGAGFTGVVEELAVTVTDGSLTIEFGRIIQNPTISGLEIITEGTGSDEDERGADGHEDLILAFSKRRILHEVGPVRRGDVLELTISGELRDGTPFSDADVVIVGWGDRE